MTLIQIWPEPGKEAETAKALLTAAGPNGVTTNTDAGLSFLVNETTATQFYNQHHTNNPPNPQPEAPHTQFNPTSHSVADVLKHLRASDETERNRVIDIETSGKGRATILNFGR